MGAPRTQDEIVAFVESTRDEDWVGFMAEVLVPRLDFETAKRWLKDEVTADDWQDSATPRDRDVVLADAKEYMEFAWDKAAGHRGISASRSVQKMRAYVWLAGDDDLYERITRMEDTDYAQYGAPVLAAVCEHYGWPIPDRGDVARMIRGEPCRDDCMDGCG